MKTVTMGSLPRVIGTFLVLILGISSMDVQAQKDVKDMTDEEFAMAFTKDQQSEVKFDDSLFQTMYDINLKYIKEMNKIMDQGRSISTFNKMMDMSDRKDEEVKKVLNEEQFERYEDHKEKFRDQMRARRS